MNSKKTAATVSMKWLKSSSKVLNVPMWKRAAIAQTPKNILYLTLGELTYRLVIGKLFGTLVEPDFESKDCIIKGGRIWEFVLFQALALAT